VRAPALLVGITLLHAAAGHAGWYAYIDEHGTPVISDVRDDPRAQRYRIGDFERRLLQQKGVPHRGLGLDEERLPALPRNLVYDDLIAEAAAKYGVRFSLVKAVVAVESGFRPAVKSRAGAMGLMQLMPGTAKDLGVKDATDPRENIHGGTRYLAGLLKHFKNEELAVAAYNAGPGRVMRAGGVPRIAETRAYVTNVLGLARRYEAGDTSGVH
jgi:soluble lytic murein transglycosylase-like protein